MSKDLYQQYYDWIDWDIYKGLSQGEMEELQAKHKKKYGVNHILKAGAPLEAVKAWKEDCERTKKADEKGQIIN